MEFDIKSSFMYIRALLNDMDCIGCCDDCHRHGMQECPVTVRDLILDELDGIEDELYGE